jgi:hypothetical protein
MLSRQGKSHVNEEQKSRLRKLQFDLVCSDLL